MAPTPLASGWQLMKPAWDVAPLPEACDTPGQRGWPHGSGEVTPLPSPLSAPWENREIRGSRRTAGGRSSTATALWLPSPAKTRPLGVPLTPPWAQNTTKYHHFPPTLLQIHYTVNPETSPFLQGLPLLQAQDSGPFCPTLLTQVWNQL